MDKPISFAHKEMSIFASVIIKVGGNFLFCLSSRAMLHFQNQVSPTRGKPESLLSVRGHQSTIYWHLIVV